MAKITTHITLDVSKRSRLQAITAKQYDRNSRYINVRLTNQGDFINIPLGSLVTINAERPDFESKSFAGEVNADGTVTVRITYWMLELEGIVSCDISVEDAQSVKLSSLNFTIEVEHANYSGTEISDDDPQYDVFIQVLAGEADRVAAENERKANETERKTSEAARAQAETTRQTNESTRRDNEAVRITNENARIAEEQNRAQAENARAQEFSTWEKQIDTIDSRSIRNSKRITNLEQGLPDDEYYTDATVAYTKDVPSNALPYAEVKKIGGMTRKCTNLWDEQWEVGQLDVNSGGLLSGTTRIRSKNYIPLDGETTYRFSYDNNSNVFCCYDENYAFLGTKYQWSKTFTTLPNTRYVRFMLHSDYGATYKNDIMLNEGSTALLYEPYFEGLRDAKTTEMKSVGVNLIPFPYVEDTKTNNGVAFTVNGDGTITASGTAVDYNATLRLANNISLPAGTYRVTCTDTPKSGTVFVVMKNGVWHSETNNTMELLVESGDVLTIYLQFVVGISVSNFTFKPMLNKGSTALPYAPYMESTLPVPEAVQALDGYGWGMNADCYNYIGWEKKQFVKRVGRVDMGTLVWAYESSSNRFSTVMPSNYRIPATVEERIELLCPIYKPHNSPVSGSRVDMTISGYTADNHIYVNNSTYTDATSFKAAMSGVMLYYGLAEPVITDISDLLPEDNFIEVEGNGSITAVNEYGYDVPSEIEYQLEV